MKHRVLCTHAVEAVHAHNYRKILGRLLLIGWEPSTLDVLIRGALCINGAPKATLFSVTFDDADETVFTVARPILESFGILATVFLSTEFTSTGSDARHWPGRRSVSWRQMELWLKAGNTVGSHTASHLDCTSVSPESVVDNVAASNDAILANLGVRVKHLSFPWGQYTPTVCVALRRAFPDLNLYSIDRGWNRETRNMDAPFRRDVVESNWSLTRVTSLLALGSCPLLYRAQAQLLRRPRAE